MCVGCVGVLVVVVVVIVMCVGVVASVVARVCIAGRIVSGWLVNYSSGVRAGGRVRIASWLVSRWIGTLSDVGGGGRDRIASWLVSGWIGTSGSSCVAC